MADSHSGTETLSTNNSSGKDANEEMHPIGAHLLEFITRIDSLADTLPLTRLAIRRARQDANKVLGEFLSTKCVKSADKENQYTIPQDHYAEFTRLSRQIDKAAIADVSVPRSFLVSLVSEFDAFLSSLIRVLFAIQPQALNASEKSFSYTDVAEFASLDAFREHVVEKQIESVLRDSHADQFKWFENRFKVELRKGLASWAPFIEITERRNLFVHNDGRVTKQYLDVCKEHGSDCGTVNKNDVLKVDKTYFDKAHAIVFEIATKLAYVLWSKVDANNKNGADGLLAGHVIYELITQGRFTLAATVADFASEVFSKIKGTSLANIQMLAVNHAQTYKWLGNSAKCNAILDSQDWSASRNDFKLCVAVLREDYDEALELIKIIGVHGRPRKSDYRDWPAFRELRNQPTFQALFEQLFGEPLTLVSTAPKPARPAEKAAARELDQATESSLSAGDRPSSISNSDDHDAREL